MRLAPMRNHPAYWAFIVHRLSGLALVLFLPVHLYVLSLALQGAARLDGFLAWTEAAPVKAAELILVVLLAAHLAGGLRLLALELLPYAPRQKSRIAIALGTALAAGLAFLLAL